jgi:hypothetical protein
VLALTLAAALPRPGRALELPLRELFLGTAAPSLIEETLVRPSRYMLLRARYWDFYHERRGNTLQDYQQSAFLGRAIVRSGPFIAGVETGRSLLELKQENVYTDADRMRGERDLRGGELWVGFWGDDYSRGGFFENLRVVGTAGYANGFAGAIEAELRWNRRGALRLGARTVETNLQLQEEIAGSVFPFHFPFRNDRVYGRLEVTPSPSLRARVSGAMETSHSDGEDVKGFENKLWNRRYTLAGLFDYRLQRPDPYRRLPRLSDTPGRLPGTRLRLAHTDGDSDLGMHYKGTRYLQLTEVKIDNTLIRLDLMPAGFLSLFGGWERIRLAHRGDSFVDVWPFVIWDVFTAQRYRLGATDIHMDTWFAGLGAVVERGRIEMEFGARFEWWHDEGVLDWFKRFSVLYPFFFEYKKHEETIDIRPMYAMQLDPQLWLRASSWLTFRFSGRATVPFGARSEDEPSAQSPGGGGTTTPPVTPQDDRTHGGLSGTIEAILTL